MTGQICSAEKCVTTNLGGGGGTTGGGTTGGGGGTTGGGSTTGGGGGTTGGGGGTGGGSTTGGGGGTTGGGGGTTGGGGGTTGGGGGTTGGGGGDPMGGGGGSTGGGGGATGGGGGSTGGGGGSTGGGGGSTGGGGGSTGGGGGSTGGGGGSTGGGGGSTGGGGGSTGGGGGSTGGGGGSTGGGGGSTGGGGGSTGGGGGSTGGGGGSTGGGGGSTGGGGGTTMASGEDCASAIDLTSGVTQSGTNVDAGNDFRFTDQNGCQGSRDFAAATAGDKVYRIAVPAFSSVTGTLNAPFDSVFNLILGSATCGTNPPDGGATSTACVAGRDDPETAPLTYVNRTASAVDVFLLVDGYTNGEGTFTVGATVVALPGGDVCGNAVSLNGATTLATETILGFGNDYASGAGCAAGSSSNDRVYTVSVPSGQRITATVNAALGADAGAQFNPGVHIVRGTTCATTLTCAASTNAAIGLTDVASWDNTGASAEQVFVVIDTSTTTPVSPGNFSLDVAFSAVGPVGDTCGTGTVITASTSLGSESFTTFTNNYASNAQSVCLYGIGPDRSYTVDIPVGQNLNATLTPLAAGLPDGGTADLTLSIVDAIVDCGSGPCLAASDLSGVESLVVNNSGGSAARRVNVVVDSKLASPPGFGLSLNIAPPPVGDVCSGVGAAITATTSLATETLFGYASDYSSLTTNTGCSFGNGQDRVYSVTIPNGQRLTAAGNATSDLALNLVDGPAATACTVSPLVCAARADNNTTGTETLVFDNSTGQPRTVLLIVDRFGGFAPSTETFSLNLTLGAIPAPNMGETCSAPQVVSMSGTLTNQTTTGYVNNIAVTNTSCGTFNSNPGPDRVYEVTVGMGQTLTAVVTPVPGFDPAIYIVPAPATNCLTSATTCVGTGSDSGGPGAADTATFTNSGASRVVYVVIDGYQTTTAGDFSLQISLMP